MSAPLPGSGIFPPPSGPLLLFALPPPEPSIGFAGPIGGLLGILLVLSLLTATLTGIKDNGNSVQAGTTLSFSGTTTNSPSRTTSTMRSTTSSTSSTTTSESSTSSTVSTTPISTSSTTSTTPSTTTSTTSSTSSTMSSTTITSTSTPSSATSTIPTTTSSTTTTTPSTSSTTYTTSSTTSSSTKAPTCGPAPNVTGLVVFPTGGANVGDKKSYRCLNQDETFPRNAFNPDECPVITCQADGTYDKSFSTKNKTCEALPNSPPGDDTQTSPGTITSPGFDGTTLYSSTKADYRWNIVTTGSQIIFNFTSFDVSNGNNQCNNGDRLEIFCGFKDSSREFKLCSGSPPSNPVNCSVGCAGVVFVVDNRNTPKGIGFSFSWTN